MRTQVLICAFLGVTLGCGEGVRTIDIRGIEGPALAFVISMDQGELVSVSQAIVLDEGGDVAMRPGTIEAGGSSTRLLIIKNADLLRSAGSFGKHIMQDELHRSRLVLRSPEDARAVERDGDAWLALAIPSEVIQRPTAQDTAFRARVELEVPLRNNHACAVGGVIQDFAVGFTETHMNLDIVTLGEGRLLAVHGNWLSIAQEGDLIDLGDASDPRVLHPPEFGLYFEEAEKIPNTDDEVWVVASEVGRGELIRLRVTDSFEILERVAISGILPVDLAIGARGEVVAAGKITDNPAQTASVLYAKGKLTFTPTMAGGFDSRPIFDPTSDSFLAGARGLLLRYRLGTKEWTRTALVHRRGSPVPNAIVLKKVGDADELYIAGDDGILLRQLGDAPNGTIDLLSPPNYRCHEAEAVVSLNFKSVVLFNNRFALLGMDLCSDILVVDLDNPSCTSFIPYEGDTVTSASLESLELEGDRLWIAGRQGELRYVDLVAP